MPSATTSATLLPPSPRGAAAAPVALALALAPVAVVVATPDKLSVEPLGLAAVAVEATVVVEIGFGSVGRVMTEPVKVGDEVSEAGMVKPEAVVRGMDTAACAVGKRRRVRERSVVEWRCILEKNKETEFL